MSKRKWPEWVWVGLTARNFCKTYDKQSNNIKDLGSWVDYTFEDDCLFDDVYYMIKEHYIEVWVDMWIDDPQTTAKMQADVWNDLMADLGYTEEYK